jgi:hypothetical protein
MTRIRIIKWLESVEKGLKIFVLSYSTSLDHLAQIMRCSHCILYITTLDCQWNKNHVFYWFKLGVKKNLKVFWKLWKIEILCTLFKSCTYLDSDQIKKRQKKSFSNTLNWIIRLTWFESGNFVTRITRCTWFESDRSECPLIHFIRIRLYTWLESV